MRTEVFVREQGVPHDLELDQFDRLETTRHLVIVGVADGADDRVVVATVRWILEPAGFEGADPAWGRLAHLQRLAVRRDVRGEGLGAALVKAVEDDARENGLAAVVLSSQTAAIGFYERLGYAAHGPVFDDAGIAHRWMTKHLVSGAASATQ